MKRTTLTWLSLVSGACVLGVAIGAQTESQWPWAPSQDAISADPAHHKVLYEDANVRILEVTVAPGVKESSHTHQWSSVFLIDSFANFRLHWQCADEVLCMGGNDVTIEKPTGTAASLPVVVKGGPGGLHYSENVDSIPFHAYKVEYKKLKFTE